jgi:hypothetical protein
MPTIVRIGAWRFFFYSNEGNEPPHVHVESSSGAAKFWLGPVRLARSRGLAPHEVAHVRRRVVEHERILLEAWRDHFAS